MIDALLSMAFAMHSGKGIYAVLLGSGISRAAEIPTGWEVTLNLIEKIAATLGENRECAPDPAEWYRRRFQKDPNYSDLLEQLAFLPTERTTALAPYFESVGSDEKHSPEPTAAHLAIARLVKRGYIRVILSTNFDRLMERALEAEGVSPTIVSTVDSATGSLPMVHAQCTLIKLHGDYRDARLRNTLSELAEYDSITNQILDRVFDEYGLVVSGWSATWDLALRNALLRAKNRRFTTLWTHLGEVSREAAELIQFRGAQTLEIASADQFFASLEENIELLESFDSPHPLSAELAARAAKKYVAEERFRVRLYELVMDEVGRAVEILAQNSTRCAMSDEIYTRRIESYEAVMGRLLPLFTVVAFWGSKETDALILRVIEKLMGLKCDFSGATWLIQLQLYPASLAFYAAGIAFIAAEKYESFRKLLRGLRTGAGDLQEREDLALKRLSLNTILHLTRSGYPVPASERVCILLSKLFEQQYPSVSSFGKLFDRFEYLCALICWQERSGGEESRCSWFGRWVNNIGGFSDVGRLVQEERQLMREDWPYVKSNLFDSLTQFDYVATEHKSNCGTYRG